MNCSMLERSSVKFSAVSATMALLFAVFSIACGNSNDIADAEKEVALFRDRVKNQEFEKVYDDSSSMFKDVAEKEDFTKLLERLAPLIKDPSKMKKYEDTVGWDPTNGHYVILRYRPIETSDLKMEQFVFTYEKDRWRLNNYSVTENK